MPFTPSHAIVALPFVRTPLLPAAIAVGAMAPDLPLFLRGSAVTYQLTHTNVLVSVLLGLALWALWYALLRPAVRELSPAWLARRLPAGWDATGASLWRDLRAPRPGARHAVWSQLFGILLFLSLLLGVLSHITWDAFTHIGRWGVRLVPVLDEQWGPFLGYKWLQYGSGVIGVLVLAGCGWHWLRRRSAADSLARALPPWLRRAWWLSLPLVLVGAWLIGLAAYGPFTATWTIPHLAYRVLPPACALWAALTFALCLSVVVRRRAQRRAS